MINSYIMSRLSYCIHNIFHWSFKTFSLFFFNFSSCSRENNLGGEIRSFFFLIFSPCFSPPSFYNCTMTFSPDMFFFFYLLASERVVLTFHSNKHDNSKNKRLYFYAFILYILFRLVVLNHYVIKTSDSVKEKR